MAVCWKPEWCECPDCGPLVPTPTPCPVCGGAGIVDTSPPGAEGSAP